MGDVTRIFEVLPGEATDASDNTLRLWHVRTGRELMTIHNLAPGWGPQFGGLKFSSDGSTLILGALGPVRLFRAPSLAAQ